MNNNDYTIRDYNESDYLKCEILVSNAWEFDKNFKPQGLADIAKYMYTKGSVINANFHKVVDVDGEVVGFLFGLNEKSTLPKKNVVLGLGILMRILFLKGTPFKDKTRLLKSINTHMVNRLKLVKPGRSEIVLFVVDPRHQGVGHGKRLLSVFISQCKESGVESIIVETNTHGASSFYEGVGFKLIGNFDSPLHSYAAKDGQACMYEFKI